MIQLETIGYATESFEKLVDLGERRAELDERHRRKRTQLIHLEHALLLREQIAHDEQQITGCFDRQETTTRHVDADGTVEVLDGRTRRGLELNHIDALVRGLVVHDHFHVKSALFYQTLDRSQVDPQVVGVKDSLFDLNFL